MAVQHKRVVGRQEFGSYPLIRLRPPPEISIAAYVKSALDDERHLGTRAKFPRRNCVRADGQKFVFYDNFLARSRLAPLFEPRVDFQRYTSCHDDWLFHFRDNLRLHNEVKRFELRQAGDVARRLELGGDGGEDRVCGNYRYSRRRGREAKGADPAAEPKWVLCGKKVFADYPANIDLLLPVAPRRPRPEPEHVGWTHSDEAGSWFLEAKTPSAYDDHADFLKKYSGRHPDECSRRYLNGKRSHQIIMEDVSDVSTCELGTSKYVRPFRLKYKQDGREKIWDCVYTHRSVFIIIYNTSRQKLVLVRQFRPSVYFNVVRSEKSLTEDCIGKPLDTSSVPASRGMCIELCAGIIDKEIGELEIARAEVKEECGYDVPHSSIRQVQAFPGSVGISGERMTMFYAEVTDAMRTGAGGGVAEEGELIEVVEMTVGEVKKLLAEPEVNATPVALYGLMWFLAQHNSA